MDTVYHPLFELYPRGRFTHLQRTLHVGTLLKFTMVLKVNLFLTITITECKVNDIWPGKKGET